MYLMTIIALKLRVVQLETRLLIIDCDFGWLDHIAI